MASITEKLKLYFKMFYVILFHQILNLNHHTWLTATILDSADYTILKPHLEAEPSLFYKGGK